MGAVVCLSRWYFCTVACVRVCIMLFIPFQISPTFDDDDHDSLRT